MMDEKTAAIHLLTTRLAEIQAHQALYILRNCLAAPTILYILRSSPSWLCADKLLEFDSMIRSSLAAVTNTAMTDSVWRQATLPVARGGLGIRRTEEIAIPAFLASVFFVKDLLFMINPAMDIAAITAEPIRQWAAVTLQPLPVNQTVQKL